MFTVCQTEEFVAWLDGLKDKRAQVRIASQPGCGRLKLEVLVTGSRFRASYQS